MILSGMSSSNIAVYIDTGNCVGCNGVFAPNDIASLVCSTIGIACPYCSLAVVISLTSSGEYAAKVFSLRYTIA